MKNVGKTGKIAFFGKLPLRALCKLLKLRKNHSYNYYDL